MCRRAPGGRCRIPDEFKDAFDVVADEAEVLHTLVCESHQRIS